MTPVKVTVFVWSYIANEWCDIAGVINRASDVIVKSAAIAQCLFSRFLMMVSSFLFLAFQLVQNLQDTGGEIIIWLVPAGLEVFLPILSPRPAVIVNEARVGIGQLRRASVGVLNIAQT